MRSAVSVREGQGVVLLCGTPPRAGGKGHPRLSASTGAGCRDGEMSLCHYRNLAGSSVRESESETSFPEVNANRKKTNPKASGEEVGGQHPGEFTFILKCLSVRSNYCAFTMSDLYDISSN